VGVEPRFGRRDFGVERFAGDRLRPAAGGERQSSSQDSAGGDQRQSLARLPSSSYEALSSYAAQTSASVELPFSVAIPRT